jgi:hypothetical protein
MTDVNPPPSAAEVFSAPIESVIAALGKGIADAQNAMDRESLAMQESIDADAALSHLGLQATWYQFPKVELQLTASLAVVEQTTTSPAVAPSGSPAAPPAEGAPPSAAEGGPLHDAPPVVQAGSLAGISARPYRLFAQPVSAAFQNQFNYTAAAASTITLSIVPVPPPHAADQGTIQPRLTQAEVTLIALGTGRFRTVTADGQITPDPSLRFDLNYNASVRLWYVLQYDASQPTQNAVIVSVDDVTGQPRIIGTGT